MSNLVNVLIPPLQQPFTYDLPAELAQSVAVGFRVEVPFGRRNATGFVISRDGRTENKAPEPGFEIKTVKAAVGSHPCFDASQLEFFQWVADYYGDTLSNVIDVAVPKAAPEKFRRTVHLRNLEKIPARSKAQKKIAEHLAACGGLDDYSAILRRFPGAGSALARMCSDGAIEIEELELLDQHISSEPVPDWARGEVELNTAQQSALAALQAAMDRRAFAPFLLHGITGSGKTEVYIEAIRYALGKGLGALIIVPEIALTPQLVDRFRARLGNQLAILHSGLAPRVRWDAWRALIQRRNFIAIGARSGIFAPVHNLGLIIVDEEHDTSYKQSDGLRYNARDLSLVRGKLAGCPVVLGSATPSLETFYNALGKRFGYLPLPTRHGSATSPRIELVDLNAVKPWEMASKNISPPLRAALHETLQRGEQAFVLYNRRGFASYLQCEKCESVLECPNCSVTLTYHRHNHSLLCHYCNQSGVPPEFCRKCCDEIAKEADQEKRAALTAGKLVQRGAGTERIFEEVQELFPEARIARLDRDAVDDIEKYRAVLAEMRSGKTSIIVGTQMIAKGHDLPDVTLVGIVDCDVGLHMPDFRAGERIFQLLTQASGRAGRAQKPGRVILQSRVPRHISIVSTLAKDFSGFAKYELASRKSLSYPPFTRLLRIVASSPDKELAAGALAEMVSRARAYVATHDLKIMVLGPSPAPIEKIKTNYRWHALLKSTSAHNLNRVLKVFQAMAPRTTRLRLSYDMDPQDML